MLLPYVAGTGQSFQRAWQLLVSVATDDKTSGLAGVREAFVFGTFGSVEQPAAPLRVSFEVETTAEGSDCNKARIAMFNLLPKHRAAINKGSYVELRAGYDNHADIIFAGYTAKISSAQNGPDVVTSMECGDAEPIITYGWFHASYSEPTPLARILTDVCQAMRVSFEGLVCQIDAGICFALPSVVVPARAFAGSCAQALDALLTPLKMQWNILHGSLNIVPEGAPFLQEAEVLSTETGLIGVPSKTDTASTFSCLMNSNVSPGRLVQVLSKTDGMSGYYKIAKAKYTGDSYDQAWQVDLEATPIDPAAIKVYERSQTAVSLDLTKAVAK